MNRCKYGPKIGWYVTMAENQVLITWIWNQVMNFGSWHLILATNDY